MSFLDGFHMAFRMAPIDAGLVGFFVGIVCCGLVILAVMLGIALTIQRVIWIVNFIRRS